MGSVIEKYKLGSIEVTIEETDTEGKLDVTCNDGSYHSSFTLRRYEYEHYKRHMNQRIKDAFKDQHQSDDNSAD